MDKLIKLMQKLGIELTTDQQKQIKETVEKEFVPAEAAAADKTKLEELTKQLDELNAKYKQETDDLNAKLAAQETDFAAEKLFSEYKFASDRVRKSVLEEFKGKGFKLENGTFLGGKEYLEELKKSEPAAFAAEDKPGLFMGSTQSNAPADSNNLESQIFSGLGLNVNK